MLLARPQHRITVRRQATEYRQADDITGDVIEVATNKVFEQPAGGFTLVTSYRPRSDMGNLPLSLALKPNDLVTIELKADGTTPWVPVMVGLVDRPGRRLQMAGDRAVQEGVVTGRDLGKLFLTHEVLWWWYAQKDPFIGDAFFNLSLIGAPTSAIFGPPDKFISFILEYLFFRKSTAPTDQRGQANFYDVSGVPNFAAYDTADYWRNWISFVKLPAVDGYKHSKYSPGFVAMQLGTTNANIWNLFTMYADQPWNQLWTDTGDDGLFHLYYRPTPYPHEPWPGEFTGREDWNLVPRYKPDPTQIIGENLGVSDHDRVNLFFAKPIISLAELYDYGTYAADPSTCPILDDAAFHGVKPLVKSSMYMGPDVPAINIGDSTCMRDASQADLPATATNGLPFMITQKSHLLRDWFQDNPTYESGTITLQGDPSVRIGQCFYDPRLKMEYFIVGVDHHFIFTPDARFTTTVTVARGMSLAHA